MERFVVMKEKQVLRSPDPDTFHVSGAVATAPACVAAPSPKWASGALPAILVLGAIFIAECLTTWRKWPDITVDFGRNLYIPWRLNAGEVLYRDIDAIFGPLSHHVDAWLFRLFGTSFMTLVIANLLGIVVLTGFVYLFFRRYLGSFVGILTASVFLLVFAFGQYVWMGNFNYVTPYSQEAVHGTILLVIVVYIGGATLQGGGRLQLLVMGFLYALACMTRLDIALVGTMVVGSYFLLATTNAARQAMRFWLRFVLLVAGWILAVGAFQILTGLFPLEYIWHDVNRLLLQGRIDKNPFYATVMGTDNWTGNLWVMAQYTFCYLALVFITIWSYRHAPSDSSRKRQFYDNILKWLPMFLALLWIWASPPFLFLKRSILAIPLLVLIMGGVFLFDYFKPDTTRIMKREHAAPLLLWAVLSFAMLLKMLFNARIFHYGFVHTMPATLLLVGFSTGYLPLRLKARGSNSGHMRLLATTLIILATARFVYLSHFLYALKDYPVGKGDDQIVVYPPSSDLRGEIINDFLVWMEKNAAPQATFVVVPEGIMLNYLSRHTTTTPSMSFLPLELLRIPEEQQIAHFERRPPDYIVVLKRTLKEYGLTSFGEGDKPGARMMAWINGHYHLATVLHSKQFPTDTDSFWIRILEKNRP
ncbi:MAG: hypothetical protein HQL64_06240 [Magnetococcales bacterium]|nr:hypothetical protein [Magnetococcales bacterium]